MASVLAASIAFAYLAGLIALESAQKVATQQAVLQELHDFLSTLKDTETGQRGYLLTGDEAYLEPFNTAQARLQSELDTLKSLGSTRHIPAERVATILRLTQERLSMLKEGVRRRRDQSFDAALNIIRTGRGKVLMDTIRKEVSEALAHERGELDQAEHRAKLAHIARTVIFLTVGILNLGFLAWVYRLTTLEMARREAVTQEVTRQKELFATTLASIGDGVIVTDDQGRAQRRGGTFNRLDPDGSRRPAAVQDLPDLQRINQAAGRESRRQSLGAGASRRVGQPYNPNVQRRSRDTDR
jgi:CHASE3 domain sensor protein